MLNFKTLRICALGLAFAVSSVAPAVLCATSAGAATVLAKVNGKEITDEDLKLADQDLGQAIPRQLTGKARDSYILDYLIDGQLVAQKAEADKLDQTADFPKKLAYYREKLLMEALLNKVAKDAATDAALKAAYDEAAKQAKPETEIHARHILVATKEEADAALKRIKAGEDFAKVAKEVSKDAADQGGDLGWFTKDRMIPEFADAAFKLNPGEVSEPVKTQFGWHIIKVEDKRVKPTPTFDQVKGQIENYVAHRAQAQLVDNLRKTATIERLDKPAAPPAADPSLNPAAPAKK